MIAVIGILLSLGVATYTGVLLGSLPFRPFWNTWILPALFVASALDTGVGLTTLYASLWEKGEGVRQLRTVLETCILLLILAEASVLGYFLNTMSNSSPDAARSAQIVMNGVLSPAFWIVVVGLGLAVPFFVCVSQLSGLGKKLPSFVPVIGISSCLLGGLTLRIVVLLAGLPATLTSPALLQMLMGVKFTP